MHLSPAWLLLLIAPLAATAQTAPPPDDGYPLREVRELTIAPLPPGGLVPYRHDEWWGYADTTGRVVITPGLVLGTLFPAAGLLRVDRFLAETEDEARKKRQLYQNHPPELYAYHHTKPQARAFLNATGEVLRVAADEAAVLLPGGRLRAVRRSEVRAGQTELLDVAPLGQVEGFDYFPTPAAPFITRRLAAPRTEQRRVAKAVNAATDFDFLKHDVARLGAAQNLEIKPLGAGRYAVGTRMRVFERRGYEGHYTTWHRRWEPETGLVALVNQRGRALTPFAYSHIDSFALNRRYTMAWRPTESRWDTAGHTGLLGRRGREVLPFAHNMVSLLPGGGALTNDWPGDDQQRPHHYGLLDARGRWRLRPQTSLTSPDEAGYLRHRRTLAPGDTVVEFLTPRGRPAFRAVPALRQAAGFERGRAWVRTDLGPGLLDARGRWVAPPGRYEQILSMNETDSYGLRYRKGQAWNRPAALDLVMASMFDESFERRAAPIHAPPDTTYLLVRQGGRFGLIRRATGALVVPCRYEAITCWSGQYGTGRRDGQDYVLAARTGGELLPGQYRGEWYRFPGGPRLLQVYRDQQQGRWYNKWLVADTSGHALTPEYERVGYDNYLTPEDFAALTAPPAPLAAAAAADTTSFPLLPRPANIKYSGLMPWFHSGPGGTASCPLLPSGAYRRTLPDHGERLLVYRAGRLRDLTGHTYYALELLAGGWHHGRTAEGQELLISPTGQEYAPPPDLHWNIFYHAIGRVVPFANGTAAAAAGPTIEPLLGEEDQEGGLVTRGGTLLWGTGQRRKRH
ncbi:MAG: hypothetical protein ACRYFX_23505 [Janthinobacterium lividum]